MKVIPLSEHHETYCAEDIEIWEVRRRSIHQETQSLADSKQQCVVKTWGENKLLIPILLDGIEVNIHQTPHLGIGGILWPSSIICTRHVVKNSFKEALMKKFPRPFSELKVIDLGKLVLTESHKKLYLIMLLSSRCWLWSNQYSFA